MEKEAAGYHAHMVRLKIKEVAARKQISQRKLAKLADIDLRHVQRIFRDPYASVTTRTLDKLAKALQVDVSELLESVPDETNTLPGQRD
jgi:DNA-binding Xre family transcriptional regulator